MLGWFRAPAARASCSKRRRRSASAGERGGQHLDRDLAAEARIARAVDLAHAARAERREDLVRAEPCAWRHRRRPPRRREHARRSIVECCGVYQINRPQPPSTEPRQSTMQVSHVSTDRRPSHHAGPAAHPAGDPARGDSASASAPRTSSPTRGGPSPTCSTARDPRLVVVVGPCSIHDTTAALEYAERLKPLADAIADQLIVVMRSYFEKPRTSVGWKGLINDPDLDESFHINKGLRLARQLLLDVNDLGLPTGVGIPRHADSAAHRRPHVVGGDRRADDGEPGAPRAGVGAVDAGRLQERHRRQHPDRGRRRADGALAALVSVGDQAGRRRPSSRRPATTPAT